MRHVRHLIVENLAVSLVVVAVACGGTGFFMGQSTGAAAAPTRQMGQNGFGSQNSARRGPNAMNAVFGTISGKDKDSVTITLGGPGASSTNGTSSGSRIVFYNPTTQVGKFVTGTSDDLQVGMMVMANGTPNSDGSITATQIQIRPTGMMAPRN